MIGNKFFEVFVNKIDRDHSELWYNEEVIHIGNRHLYMDYKDETLCFPNFDRIQNKEYRIYVIVNGNLKGFDKEHIKQVRYEQDVVYQSAPCETVKRTFSIKECSKESSKTKKIISAELEKQTLSLMVYNTNMDRYNASVVNMRIIDDILHCGRVCMPATKVKCIQTCDPDPLVLYAK